MGTSRRGELVLLSGGNGRGAGVSSRFGGRARWSWVSNEGEAGISVEGGRSGEVLELLSESSRAGSGRAGRLGVTVRL
jgi:hypothetical protein